MATKKKDYPLTDEQRVKMTEIFVKYENAIYKGIRHYTLKSRNHSREQDDEIFQAFALFLCRFPHYIERNHDSDGNPCPFVRVHPGIITNKAFQFTYGYFRYMNKVHLYSTSLERYQSGSKNEDDLYNIVEIQTKGFSELFENEEKKQESEYMYLNKIIADLPQEERDVLISYIKRRGIKWRYSTLVPQIINNKANNKRNAVIFILEKLKRRARSEAHLLDFRYETSPRDHSADIKTREIFEEKVKEMESIKEYKSLSHQDKFYSEWL